jgi:hypothetical protein
MPILKVIACFVLLSAKTHFFSPTLRISATVTSQVTSNKLEFEPTVSGG